MLTTIPPTLHVGALFPQFLNSEIYRVLVSVILNWN